MDRRKILVKPCEGAGLRAHFLWQNPRFINDPICTLEKPANSVAECMVWRTKADNEAVKITRRIMKPPPLNQKSTIWPITKRQSSVGNFDNRLFSRKKKFYREIHTGLQQPLLKAILDPEQYATGQTLKERMSFHQQYDCRIDPSEPIKGKRQGCFVWEPLRND